MNAGERYKVILFDLDGTLTDPAVGITRSIQYALARFGLRAEPAELLQFIGPPLKESFRRFYFFTEEEAVRAVAYYREYFAETGLYENTVYPGISGLLQRLRLAGKKALVATSKPTVFAQEILRHFGLDGYFAFIAGSNLDGTRVDKGAVIKFALERIPGIDQQETVMIGDREYDVIGARENAIDSIAVSYGYGSREELLQAGPTYMVNSVAELRILLGSGEGSPL